MGRASRRPVHRVRCWSGQAVFAAGPELVTWAAAVVGAQVRADELEALIADPDGSDPENPFVEDTVAQLLAMLGLPLPTDMQADARP